MKKQLFKAGMAACLLVTGCSLGGSSDSGAGSPEIHDVAVLTGWHEGHEYVDLGLSVMWATCNVGASSLTETGLHFAWMEIKEKERYTYDNYYSYSYSYYSYRKYHNDYETANWLWSGNWRMPTPAEMRELINNCSIEKTVSEGKAGYCFTSKRNGGSIFFPIDSARHDDLPDGAYDYAYWSSNPSEVGDDAPTAYALWFDETGVQVSRWPRHEGLPVRPVFGVE